MEETSINEIVAIINEFQNDKASDIPIVVVKDCTPIMAPTLCRIYNHCIAEGWFPNKMKLEKITPVFKKGFKDDVNNYRPVSILPIFGKVFKKFCILEYTIFYAVRIYLAIHSLGSERTIPLIMP